MSAGRFVVARYENNASNAIYACRVQQETLQLQAGAAVINVGSTLAVNREGRLKLSKGRRAFGLAPRYISIIFNAVLPSGYLSGGTIRVVILTPQVFNAIKLFQDVNYLGTLATVVGKRGEVEN